MGFRLVSKICVGPRRLLATRERTSCTSGRLHTDLQSAFKVSNLRTMVAIDTRMKNRFMSTKPNSEESELLYEGPMSNMITTLKLFSLSSAVLGTVGLPSLLVFRGLDLFTGVHMMMVGTTMFGSIGSTIGLHYIFSPYVYTLERIPVRQCHYQGEKEDNSVDDTNQQSITKKDPSFLLKATTRSIFATKIEHVFDPETDVKGPPPGTIRPFCSFIVKDTVPLYIHEQMIQDPKLSRNLFIDNAEPIKKQKNPDPDDEFL